MCFRYVKFDGFRVFAYEVSHGRWERRGVVVIYLCTDVAALCLRATGAITIRGAAGCV